MHDWISIHAPRVGSDLLLPVAVILATAFQSTLPVWGATRLPRRTTKLSGFQSTLPVWGATMTREEAIKWLEISIHAPRVGSDYDAGRSDQVVGNFNPRSPCGERRADSQRSKNSENFNPRSPCGERPGPCGPGTSTKSFQSTLPVWGATSCASLPMANAFYFNPRSPCGERRPLN